MIESERKQIIDLIKKEVIPAIGCTEPIAVALCVAKAAETLGMKPEKIEVFVSSNNSFSPSSTVYSLYATVMYLFSTVSI